YFISHLSPVPSSPPLLSTFFFYCSGHHRDLHSFPTRRSSDLPSRRRIWRAIRSPRLQPGDHRSRPITSPRSGRQTRGRGDDHLRSEEHTSELQSRSDLVCRLLLEKKKKNIKAKEQTHRKSKKT